MPVSSTATTTPFFFVSLSMISTSATGAGVSAATKDSIQPVNVANDRSTPSGYDAPEGAPDLVR